ncbi:MAG: hypothetical protein ABI670_06025 [Chloroflexota bacterium]
MSSTIAWVAQLIITVLAVALLGSGMWAVAIIAGLVAGAAAGGAVYAHFLGRALKKVLPMVPPAAMVVRREEA